MLKIKTEKMMGSELQPGNLFSTAGPEHWDTAGQNGSVGEKVYIFTGNYPVEDSEIYRIVIGVDYEATEKSPEIDALLTTITGKDRVETIQANKCTTCGATDLKFKDALSTKEYTISGMCQECQDKVFADPNG